MPRAPNPERSILGRTCWRPVSRRVQTRNLGHGFVSERWRRRAGAFCLDRLRRSGLASDAQRSEWARLRPGGGRCRTRSRRRKPGSANSVDRPPVPYRLPSVLSSLPLLLFPFSSSRRVSMDLDFRIRRLVLFLVCSVVTACSTRSPVAQVKDGAPVVRGGDGGAAATHLHPAAEVEARVRRRRQRRLRRNRRPPPRVLGSLA